MKGKTLPFLVQVLSTLSSCSNVAEEPPTAVMCRENVQRSVLVSTVDGSLTALDAGGGHVLWSFSSQKGPLFSSSLVHTKGGPHFIPGLDSHLYVLENDHLQQLPFTADMLMNEDFVIKGSFLVGSKERAVYGLNALSGEMLYACEANQCVQFNNDSVISNIDTLKITHQHTKVRGADSASGQSQWDFTIGRYKLGLVESQTDVESCAVSDMEMELGITLEVDVLAGLVKSVSKSSGAVFWTKEFTSPVVDIWGVNGGKLQKINLYNMSVMPGVQGAYSRLLGSYKGQLYVHPALPSTRGGDVPLLSASFKLPPKITADSMLEYSLVKPKTSSGTDGGSEVALYNQGDYQLWVTEGPAGHGVYFCTNESTISAGPLVPYGKQSPHTTCSIMDDSEDNLCTASKTVPVKPKSNIDWVSFVWSPYLLGTVIVLLCAAVLRSRWKRKGLEADIELLRQQTSSAQTPSTPQSLDTVVSKLVAEGCMPPGVEDMLSEQFARRSASKSESSDTSLHPTDSDSRFKVDFEPSEELGRGGFGVVYKCKHKMDGIDYAVKRIKLPMKVTGREKVMREVKALAQLDHPNIVRYFSAWVERGDGADLLRIPTIGEDSEDIYSQGIDSEVPDSNVSNSCITFPHQLPSHHQDNRSMLLPLRGSPTVDKSNSESLIIEFERPSSNPEESSFDVVFERGESHPEEEDRECGLTSEGRKSSCHENSTEVSKSTGSDRNSQALPPSFLYIQMQLCRKESLKEWLRANGTGRSRKTVMFFFEQILGAVCYVHSKGMMHRDLKPSNIFFSFDGSIKVGDFGLVAGDFDEYKQIQPPLSPRDGVSRSNSGKGRTGNVGTHLYMSPEQVQEGYIYDEKVDIFALGIILYEMNHPFATEMERTKVLESVKKGQIPPEFAERLLMEHELIVWLLNTNPLMRPSAGEIASSEKLAKLKTVVSSLSPEEECLQYL